MAPCILPRDYHLLEGPGPSPDLLSDPENPAQGYEMPKYRVRWSRRHLFLASQASPSLIPIIGSGSSRDMLEGRRPDSILEQLCSYPWGGWGSASAHDFLSTPGSHAARAKLADGTWVGLGL